MSLTLEKPIFAPLPPTARHGAAAKPRADFGAIRDQLARRPDKWALVGVYGTANAAQTTARRFSTQYDCNAVTRGTTVWACVPHKHAHPPRRARR